MNKRSPEWKEICEIYLDETESCVMPTDPEIETWLAVNVMKWHAEFRGDGTSSHNRYACWCSEPKTVIIDRSDWHPLTDANHTLMLIGKKGIMISNKRGVLGCWWCYISPDTPEERDIIAQAGDIKEAVALACAKAEVKEKKDA